MEDTLPLRDLGGGKDACLLECVEYAPDLVGPDQVEWVALDAVTGELLPQRHSRSAVRSMVNFPPAECGSDVCDLLPLGARRRIGSSPCLGIAGVELAPPTAVAPFAACGSMKSRGGVRRNVRMFAAQ